VARRVRRVACVAALQQDKPRMQDTGDECAAQTMRAKRDNQQNGSVGKGVVVRVVPRREVGLAGCRKRSFKSPVQRYVTVQSRQRNVTECCEAPQ